MVTRLGGWLAKAPLITGLCLLTAACVVKVDQLKLVSNTTKQDSHALLPYTWKLKYGDYENIVYASEVGPMTIFSNPLGDAVVLEQYALREIHRLGLFHHYWQIMSDSQWNLLYKQGQKIGTFQCGDWAPETNDHTEITQNNDKVYKQTCKAEYNDSTQNTIVLDAKDNIKYLEFFILGEEHPINLEKP